MSSSLACLLNEQPAGASKQGRYIESLQLKVVQYVNKDHMSQCIADLGFQQR